MREPAHVSQINPQVRLKCWFSNPPVSVNVGSHCFWKPHNLHEQIMHFAQIHYRSMQKYIKTTKTECFILNEIRIECSEKKKNYKNSLLSVTLSSFLATCTQFLHLFTVWTLHSFQSLLL